MITDQLLTFAQAEVPEDAGAMMRLSTFDWAVCGIAGAAVEEFRPFVEAERMRGTGAASVLGGGQTDAATAALINGTLSHALDFDDTHFDHIGHPSVAVLPAVLALAQEVGADLPAVIDAVTIGVESSILIGIWLGRGHYQIGYHQTATAGAFGAALATCRLLQADADMTRRALGLCASMASGLKAQFGTLGKPLNAGLAARSGVEATRWAQAGVTAAHDGLAGPLGFGPTHHGAAASVELPKDDWRIMSINHKFHACCHGLHAMLEALREADLVAESVDRIQIHTHPRWMSVCNIPDPTTGLEAKFSYRQTAAMLLAGHDTGDISAFTDQMAQDPDIMALRDRITVCEDPALSETEAHVVAQMRDGKTRRISHDLRQKMELQSLSAKLRKKAAVLLDDPRADALWVAVQGRDLHRLTHQLVMS